MLDASAILAVVFREPGAEFVISIFSRAAVSAVNFAEVITILGKESSDPARIPHILRLFELPFLAWDESAAIDSLKFAHLANKGFSLGDRACITEAMRRKKTKMATADRAWKQIGMIEKRVELIR